MSLTSKQVRDAKPKAKAYVLRDDNPKGLGLRVGTTPASRSGKKPNDEKPRLTWTLDYRNAAGKKRRWTIGTAEAFSLEQARERAKEAQRNIPRGIDPLDEKASGKTRITVSQALDRYLQEYAPSRIELGKLKPRTLRDYTRQIEGNLRPALGDKHVDSVETVHIETMVRDLPPVMRNRVLALASKVFRLCEDWKIRPQHTNPTRGVERASEKERLRILSADEMTALGAALSVLEPETPTTVLAIRLAALTGLRIGEVREMQWRHIDMNSGRVELHDTKTGDRTHTFPTAALALLANAPNIGTYVIAGQKKDSALDYRTINKAFIRVCREAGLEGVRLHDLRRTAMTRAAGRGASVPLLQSLLGHKTSAMALRYVAMSGGEAEGLRAAIGAETASLLEGSLSAKVQRL